jgi:hypothetical protein
MFVNGFSIMEMTGLPSGAIYPALRGERCLNQKKHR